MISLTESYDLLFSDSLTLCKFPLLRLIPCAKFLDALLFQNLSLAFPSHPPPGDPPAITGFLSKGR